MNIMFNSAYHLGSGSNNLSLIKYHGVNSNFDQLGGEKSLIELRFED